MAKMKSHDLKGIQFHNQRERESRTNPDIDKERSKENYDLVNEEHINYNVNVKEVIESQKTGTRKTRKDAVLVNELLVTSDRDFFDKLDPDETRKFFRDSLHIIQERYGKQNVAYAMVHMDEATPHMHIGVVPMRDGRLQGKNIFNRQELLWLQDNFPKQMQQVGFKLERGQKGSDRVHLSTADFKLKAEREKIEREVDLLEKKVSDKKNELLVLNEKVPVDVQVSAKREFKKVEVESKEKNIFGQPKKEIQKQPTGNVVLPEKEFKQLVTAAKDNVRMKGSMQRLLSADLAEENHRLEEQNSMIYGDWEKTSEENHRLKKENQELRSENRDLRQEIGLLYQNTKEFFKERTEDVRAFKIVFKGFVDKLKGKITGSEFERLHKRETARERNKGHER